LCRFRLAEDPIVASLLHRWLDFGSIALISEAALADTQVMAAEAAVTTAFLSLALLVLSPLDPWTTTTTAGVLGA